MIRCPKGRNPISSSASPSEPGNAICTGLPFEDDRERLAMKSALLCDNAMEPVCEMSDFDDKTRVELPIALLPWIPTWIGDHSGVVQLVIDEVMDVAMYP